MPSNWLAGLGGAAGGLQELLANNLAQEQWERQQAQRESAAAEQVRSTRATEDYRERELADRTAQRTAATAAAGQARTDANEDRDRTAERTNIAALPAGTEFSPVRWKGVTDRGAVAPERGESFVPYGEQFEGPLQPEGPQRGESLIRLRPTVTEVAASDTRAATSARDTAAQTDKIADNTRADKAATETGRHNRAMEARPTGADEKPEWVLRDGKPIRVRSEAERRSGDAPLAATRDSAADRTRAGRMQAARGFLSRLNTLRERINTKKGPEAGLTGLARQGAAAIGLDPDVAEYERLRQAAGRSVAVAIMGAQNLSDADAEAWAGILPGARVDQETAKRLMDQVERMFQDEGAAPPDAAPPGQTPPAGDPYDEYLRRSRAPR